MTISVVIPSYNRADLVLLTLDSVLAQTRPADEVIVVDDGSTDGTREAVAAYNARRGGRVRYHRRENGGLSAARNTGLALSSGEAVCMLDSDDLLRPGALAALEAALAADPDAALAYCRGTMIDAEGEALGPWEPVTGDAEGDVWGALLGGNFIRSSGAALIRRSFVERAGPWDETMRVMDDWDMWLRLAELGPFVRVEDLHFQYRIHGNSISANSLGMARREHQLFRELLARHRHDEAQYALLLAANRRSLLQMSQGLLDQALINKAAGEEVEARNKIRFIREVRPCALLSLSFLWSWSGLPKYFTVPMRVYWYLNAHIKPHTKSRSRLGCGDG